MSQARAKFAPWYVDYWYGIGWLVVGVIGSWALVFFGHKMLAAGVAVWFTFKGWVRGGGVGGAMKLSLMILD